MRVVREEENEDLVKNKGKFFMHEKFQIVILSTYESDEQCIKFCEGIPGVENMAKFIIKS